MISPPVPELVFLLLEAIFAPFSIIISSEKSDIFPAFPEFNVDENSHVFFPFRTILSEYNIISPPFPLPIVPELIDDIDSKPSRVIFFDSI